MVALLNRVHHGYGCRKIGHVEPATQVGRQLGIADVDTDFTAVALDVDRSLGIGQLDQYTPATILATTEVDRLNL